MGGLLSGGYAEGFAARRVSRVESNLPTLREQQTPEAHPERSQRRPT